VRAISESQFTGAHQHFRNPRVDILNAAPNLQVLLQVRELLGRDHVQNRSQEPRLCDRKRVPPPPPPSPCSLWTDVFCFFRCTRNFEPWRIAPEGAAPTSEMGNRSAALPKTLIYICGFADCFVTRRRWADASGRAQLDEDEEGGDRSACCSAQETIEIHKSCLFASRSNSSPLPQAT
jgi:hypothetical protein